MKEKPMVEMKDKFFGRVLKECAHVMFLPLLLNTIANILTAILGVVTANVLGNFTDAALNFNLSLGIDSAVLLVACILFVVFAVPALGFMSDFVMLKYALRHDNVIFGHYLDMEPEAAAQLSSGEAQYELEDAPNTLRIQWVTLMSKMLSLPFIFGFLLIFGGGISWLLTGLIFLLGIIRVAIPLLLNKKIGEYDRKEKSYQAKRREYESDIFEHSYILKHFNIQKAIVEHVNKLFYSYYRKTGSQEITCKVVVQQTKLFMDYFTLLLLILSGCIMIAKEYVTAGQLVSILVCLNLAQAFFNDMWDIIQNYPLFINAANRVSKFYKSVESASDSTDLQFQELRSENLTCSYNEKLLLYNFDFHIFRGDKVAILGKNGTGKSTLLKIMSSLIRSYKGDIYLNDRKFQSVNPNDWRKIIAYVPQIPYVFHGTIEENLSLGNSDVEEDAYLRVMFFKYHICQIGLFQWILICLVEKSRKYPLFEPF